MIDFKNEIKKYEPILEVGDIEQSIHSTCLITFQKTGKKQNMLQTREPTGANGNKGGMK